MLSPTSTRAGGSSAPRPDAPPHASAMASIRKTGFVTATSADGRALPSAPPPAKIASRQAHTAAKLQDLQSAAAAGRTVAGSVQYGSREGIMVVARRLTLAVALFIGLAGATWAVGIAEYPLPAKNDGPTGIAVGADGALWFTAEGTNKIGRITTAGGITEFPLPTPTSAPLGIAAGPDGPLWFTVLGGGRRGR